MSVSYLDTICNEIKIAVKNSFAIRAVGQRLEKIFKDNGHKFDNDTLSAFKKRDMYKTMEDLIVSSLETKYHVCSILIFNLFLIIK